MTRSHDAASLADGAVHDDWHPAPGKRTLTQHLQLRAAPVSTPAPAPAMPPVAHDYEDPFGLHLATATATATPTPTPAPTADDV